ncbi:MAG: hypothetical protein ACW981_11065 [Candidatus Hodarchaeales archaeon]|jgi:tRNA nucleotidyltransferase (CCA-adding enzyme)
MSDLETSIRSVIPLLKVDQSLLDFLRSLPDKLIPIITRLCKAENLPIIDVIPVGSAFRNTLLPQKIEIDLFVRFDTRSKTILATFADLIIKKLSQEVSCPFEIKYAENPYGTLLYFSEKFSIQIPIDIVATIWIKDPKHLSEILKISGMARTPFHMDFLGKMIKHKELEVKFFKYWCKKKFLYGQCGFTGFLCELLIGKFLTFENLLKNVDLISQLVWDPSSHQKDMLSLKKRFPHDQIIIIDPIDEHRNAAAGIQGFYGEIQMNRFVMEANSNLENPSCIWDEYEIKKPFFSIKIKFSPEISKRTEEELVSRQISIVNSINRQLEIEKNSIIEAIVKADSILIKTNRTKEASYLRKGPPINNKLAAEKFKMKNKNAIEKDGRLWVKDLFFSSEYTISNFFESRVDLTAEIKILS